MCKALEDLYNDGVNEGMLAGEENHLLKLIRSKLSKGMKVEEIAEILEESVEKITELMKKL